MSHLRDDMAQQNPGKPSSLRRHAAGPSIGYARRLSVEIEELCPPAEYARRLDHLTRGHDFEYDPQTSKPRGGPPIPWAVRLRAMELMGDRAAGKQKSHVVLEGGGEPIRHEVTVATYALDARDIDCGLTGEALTIFRQGQRALVERARKKLELIERAGGLLEGQVSDLPESAFREIRDLEAIAPVTEED